ncbi:COBRA-like protein 8 [Raphanus sativus]|nr:COBRA-like protein 8 [Raphanus sativus]
MGSTQKLISWILLLSLFTTIQLTSSQPQPKTPPQPPPISPDANKTAPPGPPPPPPISPDAILCNGIFLSYTYTTGVQIKPNDTKSRQAYRFESLITVLNNGRDELKSWLVFVGFAHKEILVSASNAILADGSTLPVSVENGTTFAGFPPRI